LPSVYFLKICMFVILRSYCIARLAKIKILALLAMKSLVFDRMNRTYVALIVVEDVLLLRIGSLLFLDLYTLEWGWIEYRNKRKRRKWRKRLIIEIFFHLDRWGKISPHKLGINTFEILKSSARIFLKLAIIIVFIWQFIP
jgi:hypothetical protein